MHKSCIYTRLAFKTLGAFDVTFRGKGSCVLWITGLESSWCLSHFKSLRLDHMRFVLHLIKGRFLFTNLHQTTLIPRQLFSNVIRQRAVGWCFPYCWQQDRNIRSGAKQATLDSTCQNLKDIRNSQSFQHVVPISTLYTDYLGISWPPSIASKSRPFRRSNILQKLSYCCLIFW